MVRRERLATAVAVAAVVLASSLPAAASQGTRLAGKDRYATAAAISRRIVPESDVPAGLVYVTTGQRPADALAAGPAAARARASLLLTRAGDLPGATRAELERLRPRAVLVVGGTSTIDDEVVRAITLAARAPAIRLGEADRYATAVRLSQHAFPAGARVVHIVAGEGFADGLAGGAAAARADGPLLLVPSGGVPDVVAEELVRLRPEEIRIVGGPSAVPPTVEDRLRELAPTVTRWAGADRYATAAVLAADVSSASTAVLAHGGDFADALASVPLTTELDAPLLLSAGGCTPTPAAAELRRLGVRAVVLAGGVAAQSDVVAQTGRSCDRRPGPPRLVLIGDSLMYQATTAVDEAFAARGWDTIGNAIPGSGLLLTAPGETVPAWEKRAPQILEEADPDVIVLTFIGVYFPTEGSEELALGSPEMREAWTKAFRRLDALLQARGASVWWTLVPPIREEPWREQALLVNEIARTEAPGRVIDAYEEFGGDGPWDPTDRDPDGTHFDAAGNQRFAELIADTVTPGRL